ncbi:TPA: tetratricopeptide repeat protein [Candidatus Spyradomonas excrementavium]|nr:tetratricopeptide repeat protein [Candidatus Spyradomonas excrementavium]
MKKVILLITVLFVSVISTACINNLAVQELNNKAKAYLEAGETDKAICRLRSSIDLDTNIFETHYNLGVALIQNKEYEEAQKSLENAINLKPDFPDTYYSLALSLQEQAYALANPASEEEETADLAEETENTDISSEEAPAKELTEAQKQEIVEKFNLAIENYNKYLSKKPDAKDKESVASQVATLTEEIKKYNSQPETEAE